MVNFDSITSLIVNFNHVQPFQTYNFDRVPPSIVGLGDNEDISDQHSVDVADFLVIEHFSNERSLNLAQKVGLPIAVAPDVDVEAGVVGFEELPVRLYPLSELLIGKYARFDVDLVARVDLLGEFLH